MLFFQFALLRGYAYATLGSAVLTTRRQAFLHVTLLAAAVVVALPLHLGNAVEPGATAPEWWLLLMLSTTIGVPHFLLSANSSLLQRWYHHTFQTSPYFLFSASNIGSLLGLFSYSFLVEWMLPLSGQMKWWGYGFIVLTGLFVL